MAQTKKSTTTRKRSTSGTRSTARSASSRSTSRRTTGGTATKRKAAATRRSTTAKRGATTRNARAAARNTQRASTRAQTDVAREAAAARRDAEKTVNKVVEGAQRVALTYVGATLTARDRAVEIAGTLSDRKQVERRLKAFERRGTTARNRVERELKKQRTRIERETRKRTNRVEKDLKTLRGDLGNVTGDVQRFGRDAQKTYAAQSASLFGAVTENAGQGAVLAATKAARQVTGRVAQLV
jgi:hypothetical protein